MVCSSSLINLFHSISFRLPLALMVLCRCLCPLPLPVCDCVLLHQTGHDQIHLRTDLLRIHGPCTFLVAYETLLLARSLRWLLTLYRLCWDDVLFIFVWLCWMFDSTTGGGNILPGDRDNWVLCLLLVLARHLRFHQGRLICVLSASKHWHWQCSSVAKSISC